MADDDYWGGIEGLSKINENAEQMRRRLEFDVELQVLPDTLDWVWVEVFNNLTSYEHAKVPERSSETKIIFEALEDMFGYSWNEEGSFTDSGALDIMDKDINFTADSDEIRIVTHRRISDLERGKTDWSGIKALFSNEKFLDAMKAKFTPIRFQQVMDAVDHLVNNEGAPPRPYVSEAFDRGAEYLNDKIQTTIEEDIRHVRSIL